ncbi:MAG TPA: MBL fold metallo-hydrolase, partial [Bacteroidales bacterium]|nr:MBL fold metallo-hydrolase [Bacteroidales bacterium]
HIPIYATPEIHEGINRNYGVKEKLHTCCKYFTKGVPFSLGDMQINTFGVSHDSTDCVGYVIDVAGQRFIMATDVGKVDDVFCRYIETANHLVIEANHDEQMLLNGPYPSYLKSRILSDTGHSSNKTCGETLAKHYHPELKNIFLCHLSHENNDPELAYATVKDYLKQAGIQVGKDVNLVALQRLTPSPVYNLTKGQTIETKLI